MGTIIEQHLENSLVKRIKLAPINCVTIYSRASAHTFEYLGYGPGNYSTGLPQVQVKTLTEDEEFLSQAQNLVVLFYTLVWIVMVTSILETPVFFTVWCETVFDVPVKTITGEVQQTLCCI